MVAPAKENATTRSPDHNLSPSAAGPDDLVDRGFHGPGGVDDSERATDDEDEEDDVRCRLEAARVGQKDLHHSGRITLDLLVGAGLDHLSPIDDAPVVPTGWNPMTGDGSQDHKAEQQREGMGDSRLHQEPQNSSAATA